MLAVASTMYRWRFRFGGRRRGRRYRGNRRRRGRRTERGGSYAPILLGVARTGLPGSRCVFRPAKRLSIGIYRNELASRGGHRHRHRHERLTSERAERRRESKVVGGTLEGRQYMCEFARPTGQGWRRLSGGRSVVLSLRGQRGVSVRGGRVETGNVSSAECPGQRLVASCLRLSAPHQHGPGGHRRLFRTGRPLGRRRRFAIGSGPWRPEEGFRTSTPGVPHLQSCEAEAEASDRITPTRMHHVLAAASHRPDCIRSECARARSLPSNPPSACAPKDGSSTAGRWLASRYLQVGPPVKKSLPTSRSAAQAHWLRWQRERIGSTRALTASFNTTDSFFLGSREYH